MENTERGQRTTCSLTPADKGRLYCQGYEIPKPKEQEGESEGMVDATSGGESVPVADVPQVEASGAE